jgi:hypothetical protein
MQATRFWVVTHCVLVLGSVTLLCCGKDEVLAGHSASAGGASGGGGDDDQPVGGASAGTATGGSETGGTATGGGGTTATQAGHGGVSDAPGGAADAGAPPLANGGAGPVVVERLTLCDRLTQRSTHAFNVARNYDHAVYDDCRTRWVTNLYLADQAREAFLNELQTWNLAFWGCIDVPVQSFALVYGTPPLTQGDAGAMIQKYMTVAKADLVLSPDEADEMQAALERLSQQDVVDPSLELSGSLCATANGGAGGVGGNP